MVGEPGGPMVLSATKRLGASHAVIVAGQSMPGPKLGTISPPWRSSIRVGTNQDETPRPVGMAGQTSSGVPGTSTSTWTERRPDASFFTLMMAPWVRIAEAAGAPPLPVDAHGRPGRLHRDTSTR